MPFSQSQSQSQENKISVICTIQKRPLSFHHLPILPLVVQFPPIVEVTSKAIVCLHLGLVQPHPLQAEGGTHPEGSAMQCKLHGKFDQGEDD